MSHELTLFLLALPIACVAWTVTKEEVFREPREYFEYQSKNNTRWYLRKFFYLPTCEYCFSHYVTLVALLLSGFRLFPGVVGFFLTLFALVWIANVYMTLFFILRQVLKKVGAEAKLATHDWETR